MNSQPNTTARLDPDGTVTFHPERPVDLARAELGDMTTVVTMRSPWYDDRALDNAPPLVGVLDDWGRVKRQPLNVRAWALYGRSPLCGVVWVGVDGGRPLPATLVAHLSKPLAEMVADWPDLLDAMQHALANARAGGEPDVPEWVAP